MNNVEANIKNAVFSLLAGIKVSDGAVIVAETRRLDALLAQGRGELHPQLVHFLEQRSYAKAAMYFGGATDIPVGRCGGRAGQAQQAQQ